MNSPLSVRLAALSGILGPCLFGLVLVVLTLAELDYMYFLGWEPLTRATWDWPSGLALGPYGWIMTSTFIISGGLILFFARGGLRHVLPPDTTSRAATNLLALSGFAMLGLAFETDPTYRAGPMTWHGILHNTFFVILGLTLSAAVLLLGFTFRRAAGWENLSKYTFVTIALVFPSFFLKGAFFYIFLAAILIWMEVIAVRLYKLTG